MHLPSLYVLVCLISNLNSRFANSSTHTQARTHVHMLIEWDFVDPGAHAGGWTSKRALLFLFCFSLGRMAAVFLVLLVIKGERCLLKFFLSFFLLLELCLVQPAVVVVVVVVVRLIVGCPCVYNYQRTHVCYVSRFTTSLPLPWGAGDVVLEGERGGSLGVDLRYLLDLGVEINLIVEPAIVLSSSLLGTVEGLPQVFGR